MSRISWLSAAALFGVAAARQHAAAVNDVLLSKAMSESLAEIAAPYLDESEIGALVDLSSPKDQMLAQVDGMQKEIMKECNKEQATFDDWLRSKQADLLSNNQQLTALQQRQQQLKDKVDAIQGQIIGSQRDQDTLQAKLADAQKSKSDFAQQLQQATDQRATMRAQNLALIQQHKDALQALSDLRKLIAALNTDSDEVMEKLGKAAVLKKHDAKIGALVDSVKTQLAEFKSQDPQVKAALKAKLLGLIDQIAKGVQESLDLYQRQEDTAQQKFDNEIRPGLLQMIAQAQATIDSLQAQLGQVLGNIGSLSTDLAQAKADLATVVNQVQNLLALIQSIQSQIDAGTSSHATKQKACRADLDALETVRQFIVANIKGMTPGNNCNPNSPNCDRCLYNEQCPNGQVCSDSGSCGPAPTTPPPKTPYYQLLPKTPVPWAQGRRVDVGVVPPSSFQLSDFTYVFKYQQLAPTNGWANLFNVLDVGDGWPFPNQAALFLINNVFEIDVCMDGMAWPSSYWYRNFNQQQVQIGAWTAVALVVSSSTRMMTFTFRDANGNVRTQQYPDFHGRPSKFANTGAWVNGRGYNSLQANFADFRRYDSALGQDDVLAVFKEFFA